MCLILVAYKVEPHHPLIVAANRDEYFARPTRSAHYWPDHSQLFGGRDLREQGTWMGVSRTGRFAAVTNWSHSNNRSSGFHSRGFLVRDFLISDVASLDFVHAIERDNYRGCNLIVYDGADLVHWSNRSNSANAFGPGIHGFTNASLQCNSPRVSFGRSEFERLTVKQDVDALLALLGPRESPRTNDCFIDGDTYGTRASTAVVFGTNTIIVSEQQYGPRAVVGALTTQEISLVSN